MEWTLGDLRARYRKPRGVEQFGIEAMPPELKAVRYHDLFAIVFNFLVNPGVTLVGGACRCVRPVVLGGGCGRDDRHRAGVRRLRRDGDRRRRLRHSRSGRDLDGRRLARHEMDAFAVAHDRLDRLIRVPDLGQVACDCCIAQAMDRDTVSLVGVSLAVAVLQTLVALVGYGSLKLLARVALPAKLLTLIYLVALMLTHEDQHFAPSQVLAYPSNPASYWL